MRTEIVLEGSRKSVEALKPCKPCGKLTSPLLGAYLGSTLYCRTCLKKKTGTGRG